MTRFILLLTLLMVVLAALPLLLSLLVGWGAKVWLHLSRNWGLWPGVVLSILMVCLEVYGFTRGFSQLQVRRVEYASASVPPAFDGYRIVQFSDAHVGSFSGMHADLLRQGVDAILAEKPDLVVFTGDIENLHPDELEPHAGQLSRIRAKDGVFSILGNHDYSLYLDSVSNDRRALQKRTQQMQRSFGWHLLMNENRRICRGSDSIVIAGEENWGRRPFPQFGKLDKALAGVGDEEFLIMLSHDPTAWHQHIMPVRRPEITLSGHTHGTQFSIFGWTPAMNIYEEWGGEYHDGESMLYVSTGFGGNFPFRLNMPREIVVITLRHTPEKKRIEKTE